MIRTPFWRVRLHKDITCSSRTRTGNGQSSEESDPRVQLEDLLVLYQKNSSRILLFGASGLRKLQRPGPGSRPGPAAPLPPPHLSSCGGMTLALLFTCRSLLVLLISGSVHSDRTSSFLITENMWPRGCVLDCQRGRHRAVCGSNGRLYKSPCSFQRAQCINTQLRLAPRAHCSDVKSKCQLAQAQALEANARNSGSAGGAGGHVSPAATMFVPDCHPDGHFLPVQCHNQTGFCWCSTPDGKPLGGTSVLHVTPDCSGLIDVVSSLVQTTDTESVSVQDKDADDEPEPTTRPGKSTDLTAPPIWVTILMNSVRRPTDSPQTCERERASLLSQVLSPWQQEERFLPECTADGRYRPVQCHAATGYCWCVRVDTGRPLSGTSARNRIPECTGADQDPVRSDVRFKEKPLPGCPGARKEQFLQSLVRALQLEAERAGSLSPYRVTNSSVSVHPTSVSPSSSLSVAPDDSASSRPDEVLRWHFGRLDVDSSGVLSEREARPLRRFLRRRLKPRRCAKKFAQYCDRDGDRGLTLDELRGCLGL